MSQLTAEDLARLPLSAPYELRAGTLWRRRSLASDGRGRAAAIARLLSARVGAAGGWASAHLVVVLAREPDSAARPDVAVSHGEPPVDGITSQVPPLVVLVGDCEPDPERWLRAGSQAVWVVSREEVRVHEPGGVRVVHASGVLSLPSSPGWTVGAGEVCCAGAARGAAPPAVPSSSSGHVPPLSAPEARLERLAAGSG